MTISEWWRGRGGTRGRESVGQLYLEYAEAAQRAKVPVWSKKRLVVELKKFGLVRFQSAGVRYLEPQGSPTSAPAPPNEQDLNEWAGNRTVRREHFTAVQALYDDYTAWAVAQGSTPCSKLALSKWLIGQDYERSVEGNVRVIVGIALVQDRKLVTQ